MNKKRKKGIQTDKNKVNKRWFRIKYPKFLLLLITYIFAWMLFAGKDLTILSNFFNSVGYFGAFLAGTLYTYGFTSGPSAALFLILAGTGKSLVLMGVLGGLGALFGDFLIFKFIRTSFNDELKKLSEENFSKKLKNHVPLIIKQTFIPILGGIIIASPLPDEIGVAMLALSKNISTRFFAVLSFLFNSAGILVIIALGSI